MVLDGFIFPAPEPSYDSRSYPANLLRLPNVATCGLLTQGESVGRMATRAPLPQEDDDSIGTTSCTPTARSSAKEKRSPKSIPRTSSGKLFIPQHAPAMYITPNRGPIRFLLLLMHANATDLGNMDSEAHHLSERLHCTVLMPEYPGYGLFKGKPTMAGINEAAWAAFQFATGVMGVPESRIVIYGRSIGTGVAVHLAAEAAKAGKRVSGVCIVSPYTSLLSVVRDHASCVGLLFSHRWQLLKEVPAADCPLLLVHGQRDTLIKPQHSVEIVEKLKGSEHVLRDDQYHILPKSTGVFPHEVAVRLAAYADHNKWRYEDDILQPLMNFVTNSCGIPEDAMTPELRRFDHLPYLWAA
eukprot:TRINITY_DN7086_c0_g2_i1.p1 TRINITY_DN7086_c0_g2~~TRINITY_DN7086_c0_g2_i1.p1  ORF type:complete len:355 (+),score=104.82 TRINITY_DN7086_c0_g2_i1:227-1291(+)